MGERERAPSVRLRGAARGRSGLVGAVRSQRREARCGRRGWAAGRGSWAWVTRHCSWLRDAGRGRLPSGGCAAGRERGEEERWGRVGPRGWRRLCREPGRSAARLGCWAPSGP
jgi:hypothetical protein